MTEALYPGEDVYPSETLYPQDEPALTLPSATTLPRPAGVRVLYGDLRTGRITGELPCADAPWVQALNGPGSIDQVTVPDDAIRRFGLRHGTAPARCFLAADLDGRLQEAGPIWSRVYDWEAGQLTLGAAGLWSLFDYRMVLPVLAAGQKVQKATTVITGVDYGTLARRLVAQAMTHAGGDLPLVLEDERPGTRTETFPGWKLLRVGDQLRELTQRETAAPDIRFVPRYKAGDRRFVEWVLETGTETRPQLAQTGADWVFDTTARRSPVLGIGTDEDATVMGSRGWVTGEGSEEDTLIATAYDPALVDRHGYPLLEQEDSRSTVDRQSTLDGHAANLVGRIARPVEVWKVTVHASAAREVVAGDYARVVTKGHPWLGTGERRMRVEKKTGDRGDRVVLHMFPLQGVL
jgi:hypothetical protein